MRSNACSIFILFGSLFVFTFSYLNGWRPSGLDGVMHKIGVDITLPTITSRVNYSEEIVQGQLHEKKSMSLEQYFTPKNHEVFYVIYNRVPKCGSTTTEHVLQRLSDTNRFENWFHYNHTDKHRMADEQIQFMSTEFAEFQKTSRG